MVSKLLGLELYLFTWMIDANIKMIVLNGTNCGKTRWKTYVSEVIAVIATQKSDFICNEEWDFKYQQVYDFIRQYVEDNVYNHIANKTHARTL